MDKGKNEERKGVGAKRKICVKEMGWEDSKM